MGQKTANQQEFNKTAPTVTECSQLSCPEKGINYLRPRPNGNKITKLDSH